MKRFGSVILTLTLSFLFLVSCQNTTKEPQVKYAFLFIGDGMGQAQVNTAQAYTAILDNKPGFKTLTFTQFPVMGCASTYANNRFITCSAAAGTALATGNKTNIGVISMNPECTKPLETIAEKAKKHGLKAGIITSVSIDHATPSAFYAHQPSRSNYFEIGLELANSHMDFFGGGGFKEPMKVIDGDTIHIMEKVIENGFTLVNTPEDFDALTTGNEKVLAIAPNLADGAALPYMIDGNIGNPTLANYTQKAIDLLQDSKGFFIMVEGGKIDWACHGNDAATNVLETLAFDDAVAVAKAFYDQHPDETIIVVTADHETGGLALGNSAMKYESNLGILAYQRLSSDGFNKKLSEFKQQLSGDLDDDFARMMELVSAEFGLGDTTKIPLDKTEKAKLKKLFEESIQKPGERETLTYGSNEQITSFLIKLISNKSGLGWTTYAHTGINVPVYAIGPGSELFGGMIDNTDIPKNLEKLLAID
jgi:alkaline phosphatase